MKLLIVDDEPLILAGLCSILEKNDTGFSQVRSAGNAVEAFKMLSGYTPDLVIVDIKMPEMDGFEFIRLAKDKNLCQRFIIISGYDEFEYARQAVRHHVIDYLTKPIVKEELIQLLQRIAEEIHRERQPIEDEKKMPANVLQAENAFHLIDESKCSENIKKVLTYIHEHYKWSIVLGDIADHIKLNSSYISTTFKKETGMNLVYYIHYCRITSALKMMKEHPEFPMSKISYQVGYENPRHFFRVFKRYMHTSPGEVRKHNDAEQIQFSDNNHIGIMDKQTGE